MFRDQKLHTWILGGLRLMRKRAGPLRDADSSTPPTTKHQNRGESRQNSHDNGAMRGVLCAICPTRVGTLISVRGSALPVLALEASLSSDLSIHSVVRHHSKTAVSRSVGAMVSQGCSKCC